MDNDAIRDVVIRLSRPHPSGGDVIERAAILAEGAHSPAVVAWIIAHDGAPEAAVAGRSKQGLHGARLGGDTGAEAQPLRYVLPPNALA